MKSVRVATAAFALLAIAGCGNEEQKPQEQAQPARPSADAELLELSKKLAVQEIKARLDPAIAVLDMGTVAADRIVLKHDQGPAFIPTIDAVPAGAVIVDGSDCKRTLDPGGECRIELSVPPGSQPGTAAVIVKGPGVALTAEVRIVGAAPAPAAVGDSAAETEREAAEADMAAADPYAAHLGTPGAAAAQGLLSARPNIQVAGPQIDMQRIVDRTRRIPLTLEHPILTTGEGSFTAVTQYPVYGDPRITKDGLQREELLPQGARVRGRYSTDGGALSRVDLTVDSIEFHGRRLDVAPLHLYDAQGRGLVPAQVDNRLVQQGLATAATTLLAVAPLYLTDGSRTTVQELGTTVSQQSNSSRAAEIATDRFTEFGDKVIKEQFDTATRKTIPAGQTLILMPSEDWYVGRPGDSVTAQLWVQRQQSERQRGIR